MNAMKSIFTVSLLVGLYHVSSAMEEEKISMTTYVTKKSVVTHIVGGTFPNKTMYTPTQPKKLFTCNPDGTVDLTDVEDVDYKKLIELCPERKENDPNDLFYVLEFVGEGTDEKGKFTSKTCYTGVPDGEGHVDLTCVDGCKDLLATGYRILVGADSVTNNETVYLEDFANLLKVPNDF